MKILVPPGAAGSACSCARHLPTALTKPAGIETVIAHAARPDSREQTGKFMKK